MGPATERTLTRLTLLFQEHGVTDRGDRLRLCSDHVGRLVPTMKALSQTEAHELIVRLDGLPRNGGVRAAADRLAARLLASSRVEAAEAEVRAEQHDGYVSAEAVDELERARAALAAAGMLAEVHQ